MKKTTIKIGGNEVMSIDFHCYVDLWKSPSDRINMAYQGIGKANMLKHRVGAGNASTDTEDQAIAGAFKNRFCIPLDFELLETHMPFYQAGLGDRLEYELTFNDYYKVINYTDAYSSYAISKTCLEFDMVTDSELARQIRPRFSSRMAILYDRILRHILNHKEKVWYSVEYHPKCPSKKHERDFNAV